MTVQAGTSAQGLVHLMHLDRACVGLIEADVSGRLTLANRYCRNLLGYGEAELMRLSLRDIAYPDPSLALQDGCLPSLTVSAAQRVVETTFRRKDGAPLRAWISVQATRRGGGGSPDTLFILFILADAWRSTLCHGVRLH